MLLQTLTPQNCTISAKWALKAFQVGDPQTFTISAEPHPHTCTGLHNLCSASPWPQGLEHLWSTQYLCSTGLGPQVCTGLNWYPLHWIMSLRPAQVYTISTLQACAPKACPAGDPYTHDLCSAGRTASSAQAGTISALQGHAPGHRRAPNLPKRLTQTGLDTKGVTSQLRLQFYCSRTGEFFSLL
jgi:hypothetical protein